MISGIQHDQRRRISRETPMGPLRFWKGEVKVPNQTARGFPSALVLTIEVAMRWCPTCFGGAQPALVVPNLLWLCPTCYAVMAS